VEARHEDHMFAGLRVSNMVTSRYIPPPLLWGGQQCFLGIGGDLPG
jgi:hypothetical protein